ncbi:hypothetical protein [Microbacterium luteum]
MKEHSTAPLVDIDDHRNVTDLLVRAAPPPTTTRRSTSPPGIPTPRGAR